MSEIRLEKTCPGFPEQYDAFVGDKRVGYLRLRHGTFRVECPGIDRGILDAYETVYCSRPDGDGLFEEYEREYELGKARAAISEWLARNPVFLSA